MGGACNQASHTVAIAVDIDQLPVGGEGISAHQKIVCTDDPRLQGVLAAEVANEYFSNADAEFGALSSIELSVVTKENADDYEVAW